MVRRFMRFIVTTAVQGRPRQVFAGFTHDLLLKLTPPGMRVHLLHADPPEKNGGQIHLQVTILGLIRQEWKNEFSDHEVTDDRCHFVDTGLVVPFPIRHWRHDHRVEAVGDHTAILDDVTFRTRWWLTDVLLLPFVWLQFRYRRPIYRRVFGKS